MPTDPVTFDRWRRILILLACLAFYGALAWGNYTGAEKHPGLLVAVLLAMLYGLTSVGVIQLPLGANIPFFSVWPALRDSVKALIAFALIFVWTPVANALTPDNTVGIAIVLVPDVIFGFAALLFLSNGLSRKQR